MSRQMAAGQCAPCMLTELADVPAAAALRETTPARVDHAAGQGRAEHMADEPGRHQGEEQPFIVRPCQLTQP